MVPGPLDRSSSSRITNPIAIPPSAARIAAVPDDSKQEAPSMRWTANHAARALTTRTRANFPDGAHGLPFRATPRRQSGTLAAAHNASGRGRPTRAPTSGFANARAARRSVARNVSPPCTGHTNGGDLRRTEAPAARRRGSSARALHGRMEQNGLTHRRSRAARSPHKTAKPGALRFPPARRGPRHRHAIRATRRARAGAAPNLRGHSAMRRPHKTHPQPSPDRALAQRHSRSWRRTESGAAL